eukprot:1147670-Pelagomonas_calceolata.AAC.3
MLRGGWAIQSVHQCGPLSLIDVSLPTLLVRGIHGASALDTIATYQASLKNNNLTDTSIFSAGPSGNPSFYIAWLAQEEARPSTPVLSSPIPNLIYFPDLKDALEPPFACLTQALVCRSQQATTLFTNTCYLMQGRALAMPSGTWPVFQPKLNAQSSNTPQAPSKTKNMWSA